MENTRDRLPTNHDLSPCKPKKAGATSKQVKRAPLNTDGLDVGLPDFDALIDVDAEFDAVPIGAHFGGNLARAQREPVRKMVTFDARKVKTAVECIRRMPERGESVHVIVGQAFAGFDLLPAFLELTGAPRFTRLYLTTLGFSRDNLAQLETMIRAGQMTWGGLNILCGDFFRRADSGLWDIGKLIAKEHGFTFKSYRNHTKLILAELDGRRYVVESSANLRSCQNIEQFTFTQSRALFDFHASWIDEVLKVAKS